MSAKHTIKRMRLRRVSATVHNIIHERAADREITVAAVVRPVISEVINSFPSYMRETPAPPAKSREYEVQSISAAQRQALENISSHVGVPMGDLIKIGLAKL